MRNQERFPTSNEDLERFYGTESDATADYIEELRGKLTGLLLELMDIDESNYGLFEELLMEYESEVQ